MIDLVQITFTLALFGGLAPTQTGTAALRSFTLPSAKPVYQAMSLVPSVTPVTVYCKDFSWNKVFGLDRLPNLPVTTGESAIEVKADNRKQSVVLTAETTKTRPLKNMWDQVLSGTYAQKAAPITIPQLPYVKVETAPKVAAVAKKIGPVRSDDDKLCTVNVTKGSLNVILSGISASLGVNIILVTQTEIPVTLNLKDVKLSELLKHVSVLSGLAWLRVDGSYLVGEPEKLKAGYPVEWEAKYPAEVESKGETEPTPPEAAPPTIFKSVFLSNVTAESLQTVLTTLFPGLQVVVGPTVARPGVSGGSADIGATGAAQNTQVANLPVRSLVIRGPQPVVEEAVAVAKAMDVKRLQVAIAVTIHDVTDDALRDLGLSHTPGNTNFSEVDPKGVNFGSFIRTPLGFTTAIKALETKNLAKMLARPNITALDMEQAYVLMGNRINLPRLERLDANGSPVYTVEETKVGIYLQVQPQISTDGEITLSVKPQVSTISGFIEVNGASYPNIATREASTSIRVKSGETIVMGGLWRTEEIESMDQTPILSRIPILGELFRHRKKTKSASQVIISMTPLLVGSE